MYKKRDYFSMHPIDVYKLVAKGELKKFPNNYLDKENIKIILRHLILEVYGYTREEIISKVNYKFLMDNYLGGARKFFEQKNYLMIKYCFPEFDIKAWEYNIEVGNNFWKKTENCKEFILWVAEKENIKLDCAQNFRKITAQVIVKYGGSKAMRERGVYGLLDSVFPEKYKEWEICKVNSWTKEKAVKAIKWLVEERLKLDKNEVCNILLADFTKNNLDGMLQKKCNHSIIQVLELAYPGEYVKINGKIQNVGP